MTKGSDLLNENSSLLLESIAQAELLSKYGKNRHGRRRVAAEMRKWRKDKMKPRLNYTGLGGDVYEEVKRNKS